MKRLSYLVLFSTIALVALVPIAGAQGSQHQTTSTQEATSPNTQGKQQTTSTQETTSPNTQSSQQAAPTQTNPCENPDPSNFVPNVNNPFFPLVPGTTFFYKGQKDGIPSTTQTFVTHDTKTIEGVVTTVVHDQVFEKGVLAEDTFDWYAQDKDGNVCYFGEDTKELDNNGNVTSTEGSFEAGVNGAQPGLIMEATPKVGDTYQQEFATGIAEDMAKVLKLNASTCVPFGCFDNLQLTKEWTPLEPGVVDHKFYAENVGLIREETVKGGKEKSVLVRITTGG